MSPTKDTKKVEGTQKRIQPIHQQITKKKQKAHNTELDD